MKMSELVWQKKERRGAGGGRTEREREREGCFPTGCGNTDFTHVETEEELVVVADTNSGVPMSSIRSSTASCCRFSNHQLKGVSAARWTICQWRHKVSAQNAHFVLYKCVNNN